MMNADKNNDNKGLGFSDPPSINLPRGGGSIRGMGEKFAANPVTGTGSMTIPIATSPGRAGFKYVKPGTSVIIKNDSPPGDYGVFDPYYEKGVYHMGKTGNLMTSN